MASAKKEAGILHKKINIRWMDVDLCGFLVQFWLVPLPNTARAWSAAAAALDLELGHAFLRPYGHRRKFAQSPIQCGCLVLNQRLFATTQIILRQTPAAGPVLCNATATWL